MHLPEDAVLLRIFIGESDRYRHQPLYEAIVLKAREMQLAGGYRFARPNGLWEIKSFAHRKDSSPVDGPSNRDRDCGLRGKGECIPAGA